MVNKNKPYSRIGKCSYHFCKNKKTELYKCKYCGDYFCKEHLKASLVGLPKFDDASKETEEFMEEYRKEDVHPCYPYIEHWERKKDQEKKDYGDFLDRLNKSKPPKETIINKIHKKIQKEDKFEPRKYDSSYPTDNDEESEKPIIHKKSSKRKIWFYVSLLIIFIVSILALFLIFGQAKEEYNCEDLARELIPSNFTLYSQGDLWIISKENEWLDGSEIKNINNIPFKQGENENYYYQVDYATKYLYYSENSIEKGEKSIGSIEFSIKPILERIQSTKDKITEFKIIELDFVSCNYTENEPKSTETKSNSIINKIKIQTCDDGTVYDSCSRSKPYYCSNGTLIKKATICGCPYESNIRTEGENCIDLSNPDISLLEKKIHMLINIERKKYGLSQLVWNDKIALAARGHSEDMLNRNYFEHDSPEGHDFSWRYSQVGFSCNINIGNYIYGGAENIHQGWTYGTIWYTDGVETSREWYSSDEIAEIAVDGWMNSPGHRQNILTSYWENEGIGVAVSSDGKVFVTQDFC